MTKYSFFNDYSEGAHPDLLAVLARTNLDQEDGYGKDRLCQQAEALIREKLGSPQAAVHFVSGGTQANQIVLAALLRPYESVIAAVTAHIAVHESGAIEATGHKINTVPSQDGKLRPEQVQAVVDEHTDEHMVKPRVVFISNSTEVGTIYRRDELLALAQVCRANGLYLYLDGARLGCGLMSAESDVQFSDLCAALDAFYIGGTKNGALIGEAIILQNPQFQAGFRHHLKQRGALLAKGRLIGSQFLGLFEGDLYLQLARRANAAAGRLAVGIEAAGYPFLTHSTTNQIFPILPDALIERLQALYGFYVWARVRPGFSAVRLVTSWATPDEKVDEFLEDLRRLGTEAISPSR